MATLISLLARVRSVLIDSSSLVWTDVVITEGIRLAVGEYNLAVSAQAVPGTPAGLEGLDGAVSSSLPVEHESLIVWGAAAYSALARAVDRAESFQPGGEAGDLKTWGDARLREFKSMLGVAFPGYLVVLSGSDGGSSAGDDPAKTAAEVNLLGAQAVLAGSESALAEAQALHVDGQESRAAAAAAAEAQARIDEAARLAELRSAGSAPWGSWD